MTFLRTTASAAVLAAGLALVTLVVGTWIGLHTATTSHRGLDPYGDPVTERPTLGIGVAITLLSVVVGLLAALASWVLLAYARPRLAELEQQRRRELAQAELDGGW